MQPETDSDPPSDRVVVLVGGIPGAGKSTAIRGATAGRTDVVVVDSDTIRLALRSRLPNGLPYRYFRWLVHTTTAVWTVGVLLRGPRPGRRLVVHDPSTRPRRRRLFTRLARLRRWRPALLLVDVSRADAQRGQRDRRRIVRPAAFDRHWQRWLRLRQQVLVGPTAIDGGRWSGVWLTDRTEAAGALARLLGPSPRAGAGWLRPPAEPAADGGRSAPGQAGTAITTTLSS
jgi:predicted kinase